MGGQTNYSAAKSGVVGLTLALAKEGAKKNVKVNAVLPGAGTAMTATVMPKEIVEASSQNLLHRSSVSFAVTHLKCQVAKCLRQEAGSLPSCSGADLMVCFWTSNKVM